MIVGSAYTHSVHFSFFRYCFLHFTPNAQSNRPEDAMLSAPRRHPAPPTAEGDDIEYITEFSWRNFFTTISFVKVMQKLTKGRSFRIGMLVGYKSSVRTLSSFAFRTPANKSHTGKGHHEANAESYSSNPSAARSETY